MRNYIIFGIQGSGKGTQASLLSRKFFIPHISTGDILREAMADQTPEGQAVQKYVNSGKLVPDDMLMPIFEKRFSRDDCRNGFILDGFPRTLNQGRELEQILAKNGRKLTKVVIIDLDDQTLYQRLATRRVCTGCKTVYNIESVPPKQAGICDKCGGKIVRRKDDEDRKSIEQRVKDYESATKDVIDYYRSLSIVTDIDGRASVTEVHNQILQALE